MIDESTRVTPLANMTGILWLKMPNNNHINVPKVNTVYIVDEIADVSLVRMVFKA
jgi:hypothetical protein